jgi:tRNA dimethylallyltransferase
MSSRIPLLVICGPTATGKTETAIECALILGGEIVNADALQIYRYLDIGTAKPTPQQRAAVPIHLIDFLDPSERYSAAQYRQDAARIVEEIHSRGKLPLVVGGTGFYLRALVQGADLPPAGADWELRKRLEEQADLEGPQSLHELLARVDAESARRIPAANVRRVIRALEVYHLTGRPLSSFRSPLASRTSPPDSRRASPPNSRRASLDPEKPSPYNVLAFALTMPREQLRRRIEERIVRMLEMGWLEEVRGLLAGGLPDGSAKGYGLDAPAMQAVGYRHLARHLVACADLSRAAPREPGRRGEMNLQEAVQRIKIESWQYARRQLTWFRAEKDLIWLDAHESSPPELAEQIAARAARHFSL